MTRTQRLLDERIIREITPIFDTRALGYSSMLVAAKVDSENPHRAAEIINSHPGVSHNYLRTHEFNLWFTIATPPDSELGLEGTLEALQETDRRRVDPPAPDAEAVQDQHEPRDGGRHRGARRRRHRGRGAARARAPSPTTSADVAVIRALQGPMEVIDRPYDAAAEEVGMSTEELLAHLGGMVERKILRRVAAILFHRRAGFSANGMGVWRVPEDRILEVGHPDGGGPRGLPLLPAADLRGLALQRLHDGPRALQGGVRRDPRWHRRRARPPRARTAPSSTPRPSSRRSASTTSRTTTPSWEAEHT